MRIFLIILLFVVVGCSSSKEKSATRIENVSNESFRKDKPLTKAEVKDYYSANVKALSPALQDETLDRFSSDELKRLQTQGDELVQISISCSQGDFKNGFRIASANFYRYQKIAQYWNLIANCHLNQGSQRKALLFYNKALEIDPKFIPALNNIGVMYSRQGQDQKALVAFEQANKLSRFSKTPRYNLAKLYLTYGLVEAALPLLQSLLNEAATDVDLLNSLGTAYFFTGDSARALSYYQKIPQSEWERAEIGLNLSMTLKMNGKEKEAHTVFDGIRKPANAAMKNYYSVIRNQLGDAE